MKLTRSAIGSYVIAELNERRNGFGVDSKITAILVCLLKEVGEKELNALFEGCIDDSQQGEAKEYFGAVFQKMFRQVDVTKSGHIDAAIWNCIGASKDFWEVMQDVFEMLDKTKVAA